MRNDRRRPDEEIEYWRSMADMVFGLLVVMLLVIALLLLNRIDSIREGDTEATKVEASPSIDWTPTPSPSPTPSPTPTMIPTPVPQWYDGGGYGGGGAYSTPEPTVTPFISDYDKSAVEVLVYDGETDRLIREKGIGFDLLDAGKKDVTLSVYYPTKESYTEFETEADGTFLLPEKLEPGTYTLKNLSVPDEYDTPEDVTFELPKNYDWNAPFKVEVRTQPCKNVIRLTVTDSETGEGVAGGRYEVIASRKVTTADGTVRYEKGETVSQIVCDEDGTGESGELYLGSFTLEQTGIPFGYASLDASDAAVTLEKRGSDSAQEIRLTAERTKMTVTVRDEKHLNRLEGVSFDLTVKNRTVKVTSDANGEIILTDLEKNTVYTLTQSERYKTYTLDTNAYTFTVDAEGRIDGEASSELTVSEHIVSCEFAVTGTLIGRNVIGSSAGLFNDSGESVAEWYTSDGVHAVEGIPAGKYHFTVGGKTIDVTVADTADTQTFAFRVWQTEDTLAAAGIAAAVAAVIAGIILLIKKRKKK